MPGKHRSRSASTSCTVPPSAWTSLCCRVNFCKAAGMFTKTAIRLLLPYRDNTIVTHLILPHITVARHRHGHGVARVLDGLVSPFPSNMPTEPSHNG